MRRLGMTFTHGGYEDISEGFRSMKLYLFSLSGEKGIEYGYWRIHELMEMWDLETRIQFMEGWLTSLVPLMDRLFATNMYNIPNVGAILVSRPTCVAADSILAFLDRLHIKMSVETFYVMHCDICRRLRLCNHEEYCTYEPTGKTFTLPGDAFEATWKQ
jgi:hypothetical protein